MRIRQRLNNTIFSFFAFFLIALFSIHVINTSFYTHTHILANGKMITHAHPYDKTHDSEPIKSHHHTQTEILFLKQIENFFPLVLVFLIIVKITQKIKYPVFIKTQYIPVYICFKKGRSPPVL